MTNLWLANVSYDFQVVVTGKDEIEAKENVDIDIEDMISEVGGTSKWVCVSPIKSLKDLPHGWEGCEPYGDNTKTCAQFLEVIEEEHRKKEAKEYMDKFQMKLDI